MEKIVKTIVIEVHGYDNGDIETGLKEATCRMYDSDYEGAYSEVNRINDDRTRSFKYEITDGVTDLIKSIDFELDQ